MIEYKTTSSVILLIEEKPSVTFIEISSRNPKSIPPVLVSSELSRGRSYHMPGLDNPLLCLSIYLYRSQASEILFHYVRDIKNKLDKYLKYRGPSIPILFPLPGVLLMARIGWNGLELAVVLGFCRATISFDTKNTWSITVPKLREFPCTKRAQSQRPPSLFRLLRYRC